MTKQAETNFSEKVARELGKIPMIHFDKISQRSKRGFPDYLIVAFGRAILWELKVPGKKPDKLQTWKLAQYAAAGAVCRVVWPHTLAEAWEEVKAISEGRDPLGKNLGQHIGSAPSRDSSESE